MLPFNSAKPVRLWTELPDTSTSFSPPLVDVFRSRVTHWLESARKWHQRRTLWHELTALSAHHLKDIGLSRAEVEAESFRPDWRDWMEVIRRLP